MNYQKMIAISGLAWMMASGRAASADTPDVPFASYQGFVVQLPASGVPDGQISLCMVPGAPELTANPSVALEQCSTQSPPVTDTTISQLLINGLCLSVAEIPDFGFALDLEPCNTFLDANQMWAFRSGVIQSQGVALCLNATGNGTGSFGGVELGDCTPADQTSTSIATNLFMPINYAMNLLPSQMGFCLTNLQQPENSDTPGTALKPCASTGTQFSTRPDQLWIAKFIPDDSPQGFTSYDVLSKAADHPALDVFSISSNTGTVDLATPRDGLRQHWYFTVTGNGSQPGFSLIAHGLGTQCLDVLDDAQVKDQPIDTFSCVSQFGDGDNDAQQWVTVIPGFAH